MSPDSFHPEGASLETCCSASSAHGTTRTCAQRLGLVARLATSNLMAGGSLPETSHSPAPKMATPQDISYQEGASLESCCSASSAHGSACTGAQTMGLLACFTPLNLQRYHQGLCLAVAGACLESEKVSRQLPHRTGCLGKFLLSIICPWHYFHSHKDSRAAHLTYPLKLQSSHLGLCPAPAAALPRKCRGLQISLTQKGLAWKAHSQPHLPIVMLPEAQRVRGCAGTFARQT